MILAALTTQALLSPDSSQIVIQVLIFAGICVHAGVTILTHHWDMQDRARKQRELVAVTSDVASDVKREVVATTQLQLAATKTAAAEVKAVVRTNGGELEDQGDQ